MNVPSRMNHRRRIIYTALRMVLDKDKRIPKMFMLWDKKFGQSSTFMVATYIDTWVAAGLLKDQEKRELSRALIQAISYEYDQLKSYPEEFVKRDQVSSPEIKPDSEPVSPQTIKPDLDQPLPDKPIEPRPPLANKLDTGIQGSSKKTIVEAVKLTQSGVVLPAGYVMFQETMQIILKHLKNTGQSNDVILQALLQFMKERQLSSLEPLLMTWSKQGFSSEHLPKLKDPKVMQVFMVMFYKITSDYIAPVKAPEAFKIQKSE